MWLEQLNVTPMGPDQGREHGQWLQELEEKLRVQEECLSKQHQALETIGSPDLHRPTGSGEERTSQVGGAISR